MDKNQWSAFKLRVNINSDIQTAYRAIATAEGLESWFLRKALFKGPKGKSKPPSSLLAARDTYEWYWHGYPDSVVEKGTIIKANGQDVFAFTFSLKCPVTITLYKEAGTLIVELLENDLPTDETSVMNHFVGDSRGWIFYLTNLKSILEGGLDLRNKDPKLTNVITA